MRKVCISRVCGCAENYQEKADILRIGSNAFAFPKIWLGDLRAQIGACKTGERRFSNCLDTLWAAKRSWTLSRTGSTTAGVAPSPRSTSCRRASSNYEIRHDPVPGVADEGIPIRVKIKVDPEEGQITVDVRDNIDCVNGGLNLSENTCTGSCRSACSTTLIPRIPHNHGSASVVKVLLREGSAIGKPRYPAGTSVATTNVNDRLITAVNAVFSKMGSPYGLAEGGPHLPAGIGVISGSDPFKDGHPYVNQVFIAYAGGAALDGHDGWLTYCGPANGGLINLNSIEVDESMYPIIIELRGVRPDTQGFGKFEGAPGVECVFYPVDHAMTIIYAADGTTFPPKGVNGGLPAAGSWTRKQTLDGQLVDLACVSSGGVQVG